MQATVTNTTQTPATDNPPLYKRVIGGALAGVGVHGLVASPIIALTHAEHFNQKLSVLGAICGDGTYSALKGNDSFKSMVNDIVNPLESGRPLYDHLKAGTFSELSSKTKIGAIAAPLLVCAAVGYGFMAAKGDKTKTPNTNGITQTNHAGMVENAPQQHMHVG